MKTEYFPETGSMYIHLLNKQSVDTKEVSPGVMLDYDSKGNLTEIDIDNASKKLDLKKLVLNKIPSNSQILAA